MEHGNGRAGGYIPSLLLASNPSLGGQRSVVICRSDSGAAGLASDGPVSPSISQYILTGLY